MEAGLWEAVQYSLSRGEVQQHGIQQDGHVDRPVHHSPAPLPQGCPPKIVKYPCVWHLYSHKSWDAIALHEKKKVDPDG